MNDDVVPDGAARKASVRTTLAARAPFLILGVVGVAVTAVITVAFAGGPLGYVVFLGAGLFAGLATASMIARRTTRPLWLVAGAVLVATASLAAPLLVVLLIFAIAGAGS